MTLTEYLDGMRSATSAPDLEAAIQAPFKHAFQGKTWAAICKARIEAGVRICAEHPHGSMVPSFGRSRRLAVCGEEYKVGRGYNSTGVRYVWHYAEEWAIDVLTRAGLSHKAAHAIWDSWSDYPHRCLSVIEDGLAGKMPDPQLNVLIRHAPIAGRSAIRLTVEENESSVGGPRASRPCECGGVLFDWGCGNSSGFEYINWRCNACPEVFTEYMTRAQLYTLRNRRAP